MLRKIQSIWNYLRVFSTIQDIRKFRLVAYGNGSEPEVVNVRAARDVPHCTFGRIRLMLACFGIRFLTSIISR